MYVYFMCFIIKIIKFYISLYTRDYLTNCKLPEAQISIHVGIQYLEIYSKCSQDRKSLVRGHRLQPSFVHSGFMNRVYGINFIRFTRKYIK